jgi:hypothetical protein
LPDGHLAQRQKIMEPTIPVICLKCGGGVAIRINRSGFWQCKVLGHLGYYPWKCGACGRVFMVRRRSERPRSKKRRTERGQNESPQT